MSAVGEAGQHTQAAGPRSVGVARGCAVALRALLGAVLVLAGLAVVGGSVLSWRLSQGPLEVSGLANLIARWALPIDKPARLVIGQASLLWDGFEGGDRGLLVRLGDVELLEASGPPLARVARADVTVSLPRLLALQVAPRIMLMEGVRLRAIRSGGAVALMLGGLASGGGDGDGGGGADLASVLDELRKPAKTDRGLVTPGLETLSQLQRVRIRDASVSLFDAESGSTVDGTFDAVDLRRQQGGGVQGEARGTVSVGAATASLAVTAGLLKEGGTHLEARLAPLQAAAMARSTPGLAMLGVLDGAVAAQLSLDLSAELRPRAGTLSASTGPAKVKVRGGSLQFERLATEVRARWSGEQWLPEQVELVAAQAVVSAPGGGAEGTLGAHGSAQVREGRVDGRVDLTLDRASFADLPQLWPVAWSGHVRPWLTDNVTAGVVRDGAFHFTLAGPVAALDQMHLTDAGGTMEGEDVTIHWLRPVAPVEHARAHMELLNADVLDITVPSAAQGNIALRDGLLHFTGLAGNDQFLSVTSQVQGRVSEVLALLRDKRLGLLDRHPLPVTRSGGAMAGTLTVQLPMKDHLEFDQVLIQAKGRLQQLVLGGVVGGRDLDRGEIAFEVDQNEMNASGAARVAGIPATVVVGMDFRSGPPTQVVQRASLDGRASVGQLEAAGLDTQGVLTGGTVGVQASYAQRRDGSGEVSAEADLGAAGLSLLGWQKLPGPAAHAAATFTLEHDALAGIRGIRASGPGMQVLARSEVVDGRLAEVVLERAVLGQTQVSGEVWLPGGAQDPLRVRLAGPVVDLSRQLGRGGGAGEAWTRPVIADLRFGRVILPQGHALVDLAVQADWNGRQMERLEASSGGPERLRAVVAPDGAGRRVSARLEDAGTLLRALGYLDALHGGSLALEARYTDRSRDAKLVGTLDVSEFGVRDAVVLGKLLQAITVYGIVDALKREGVYFKRLILPFSLDRDVLQIGEARAYSASLGLTAQGWIDFGRHNMNLRGTVVPAYAINTALGRLPVVGRLFSPEVGGGLVAVNYALTGRVADPSISVNPLSALTPGFLRRVFSIFD